MELKINGKTYPFRLELSAMRLYAITKGIKKLKTKDLGQLMEDADLIEDYPVLIWAGLTCGGEFSHSLDEVNKWMDDDPAAFDRAMDLINADTKGPEVDTEKKEKANP